MPTIELAANLDGAIKRAAPSTAFGDASTLRVGSEGEGAGDEAERVLPGKTIKLARVRLDHVFMRASAQHQGLFYLIVR